MFCDLTQLYTFFSLSLSLRLPRPSRPSALLITSYSSASSPTFRHDYSSYQPRELQLRKSSHHKKIDATRIDIVVDWRSGAMGSVRASVHSRSHSLRVLPQSRSQRLLHCLLRNLLHLESLLRHPLQDMDLHGKTQPPPPIFSSTP